MKGHDEEPSGKAPGKKDLARRNILLALFLAGLVLAIYITYMLLVYFE